MLNLTQFSIKYSNLDFVQTEAQALYLRIYLS